MQLDCKRCRKRFNATADTGDQFVACPHCGEALVSVEGDDKLLQTPKSSLFESTSSDTSTFTSAPASEAALPTMPGYSAKSPPPLPSRASAGGSPPPSPPPLALSSAIQPIPLRGNLPNGTPPDLAQLPAVSIWKSWRSGKVKLPHYLVRGRGGQMEKILQSLVAAIWREDLPGTQLALAGELTNLQGVIRPLRVIHSIRRRHKGITDILFRAEGNDLYVQFHSNPRTWITFLRIGLYVAVFLLVYVIFMATYMFSTGAYEGWATDYAQKHAKELYADQDKAAFLRTVITQGYNEFDNVKFVEELESRGAIPRLNEWINERSSKMAFIVEALAAGSPRNEFLGNLARLTLVNRFNNNDYFIWTNPDKYLYYEIGIHKEAVGQAVSKIEYTNQVTSFVPTDFGPGYEDLSKIASESCTRSWTSHRPWKAAGLFFADPKLALLNIGGPSTIIALIIGAILYFMPVSILRIPCRKLGWPTPDEFQGMVQSRNAWVERVLSDVLLHEFGVQEGDRFVIMAQ